MIRVKVTNEELIKIGLSSMYLGVEGFRILDAEPIGECKCTCLDRPTRGICYRHDLGEEPKKVIEEITEEEIVNAALQINGIQALLFKKLGEIIRFLNSNK